MATNSCDAAGRLSSADYTRDQNMAAFDRLPKALRVALHDSAFNWSAASILYQMRKRKMKAAQVIEIILRRDAETLAAATIVD